VLRPKQSPTLSEIASAKSIALQCPRLDQNICDRGYYKNNFPILTLVRRALQKEKKTITESSLDVIAPSIYLLRAPKGSHQ